MLTEKDSEKLFRAIGEVDENILLNAEEYETEFNRFKSFNFRRVLIYALGLTVLVFNLQFFFSSNPAIDYDEVIWNNNRIEAMSVSEAVMGELRLDEQLAYLLDNAEDSSQLYAVQVRFVGNPADVSDYFSDYEVFEDFEEFRIVFLTSEEIYDLDVPDNIGLYFELAFRPAEETNNEKNTNYNIGDSVTYRHDSLSKPNSN